MEATAIIIFFSTLAAFVSVAGMIVHSFWTARKGTQRQADSLIDAGYLQQGQYIEQAMQPNDGWGGIFFIEKGGTVRLVPLERRVKAMRIEDAREFGTRRSDLTAA